MLTEAMIPIHDTDAVWGAWRARSNALSRTPQGFAERLSACLDLGVSWIDHADIYDDGAVENLHGEALTHLDGEQARRLRVISKCGVRFESPGQPGVRIAHYRSSADFITAQAEASLKRLRGERIDLYLLHRPDYLMAVEETARALEALVSSGKVASVGISNFSTHQLAGLTETLDLPLTAHQIELSVLANQALDSGVLEQARSLKAAILAWSPLAGGALFAEDRPVNVVLAHLAEREETDMASIALAWLRRIPGPVIPVLGTMSVERLQQQIEGLRRISLDEQDWYEILQAARGARVP
ncbi:aldo/keto reductase [Maricaulis sp.]|uniref:aldo/keto reductase n=1 Tax=Maricaulis sp. TaxID=1486257 RepID=UPI00260DABEA|nr:aldo/keto reductase [Maricaulis sp.]